MKNLFAITIIGLAALSTACNSSERNDKQQNDTTASALSPSETNANSLSQANTPFLKNTKSNWEANTDPTNTEIVLNVLKAMEKLDHQEIGKYTADSIESKIDGAHFYGTKAQLMDLNKQFFATLKNLKVKLTDLQSITNKDNSEQWIRLMYTQTTEDLKGKRDSLNVFNDISVLDGKITAWNEYIQHFPAK